MNLQGDLYEEDEYDKIEAVDADNGNLSTLVETRKDDIALERLKRLYVKLWLSLRATVRVAFQTYTDVLEAGTFIQNTMDRHMKGRNTSGNRSSEGSSGGMDLGLDSADPYLRDLAMSETERLQVLDFYNTFSEDRDRETAITQTPFFLHLVQVHMDCMNSLGEVVSIEDVDEMGGVCWTYIRVSVHGIPLDPSIGGGRKGAVSVGDTFLFSVAKKVIAEQQPLAGPTPLALPLLGDSFCVTHAVPYYRCLVGSRREESSSRAFLTCIKYNRM